MKIYLVILVMFLSINLMGCGVANAGDKEFSFKNYDFDNHEQEAIRMKNDLLKLHPIGSSVEELEKTLKTTGAFKGAIDGGWTSFGPENDLEKMKQKYKSEGFEIEKIKLSDITPGAFTILMSKYPKDSITYVYEVSSLSWAPKSWRVTATHNNGKITSLKSSSGKRSLK